MVAGQTSRGTVEVACSCIGTDVGWAPIVSPLEVEMTVPVIVTTRGPRTCGGSSAVVGGAAAVEVEVVVVAAPGACSGWTGGVFEPWLADPHAPKVTVRTARPTTVPLYRTLASAPKLLG
jgi:hypothetical protein